MGRPKRYATESEKQAAYRERKKTLSGGVESRHANGSRELRPPVKDSQSIIGGTGSGSSAPPAQNNLPVPVLAEPNAKGTVRECQSDSGEARESTRENEGLSTSTLSGGQSFSYDRKKYPNRKAWEVAVGRVERAVRYAQMFPNLIGSDDLKFQTLDWQYEHEGLKSAPK